jgi:hypothetical protein
MDVLANIVGILIILIVVTGVHVSHAPPKAKLRPVAPPQISTLIEVDSAAVEPILAEFTPEPEPEIPVEPIPDLVEPADLVAQVQQMEAKIAATTQESTSLGDSLARANQLQSDLDQRILTARELLEDRRTELKTIADRNAQQKHDLELARQAIVRLQAAVTEAEKKSPPVERLQHRITPISRAVLGRELHFRLEHNRVAEVPLEALVERLKDHIERRKDWIVKTRQHKGQVGPINGFNLEYLLGVEAMSSLEEARTGMGGYRMSMRYWEIHPESSLRGEGEDVATSQGSKFYQALVSSPPDTTLTFWVYPDSYSLYRKLQAFAHEHGFLVAGRPLPAGVAISGSPNGTRSSGQ